MFKDCLQSFIKIVWDPGIEDLYNFKSFIIDKNMDLDSKNMKKVKN